VAIFVVAISLRPHLNSGAIVFLTVSGNSQVSSFTWIVIALCLQPFETGETNYAKEDFEAPSMDQRSCANAEDTCKKENHSGEDRKGVEAVRGGNASKGLQPRPIPRLEGINGSPLDPKRALKTFLTTAKF
jgi:hypothetical protein